MESLSVSQVGFCAIWQGPSASLAVLFLSISFNTVLLLFRKKKKKKKISQGYSVCEGTASPGSKPGTPSTMVDVEPEAYTAIAMPWMCSLLGRFGLKESASTISTATKAPSSVS
jgi:hypothetical protein